MIKIGIIMQPEIFNNKSYETIKSELIIKFNNYSDVIIIGIPKNKSLKDILKLIKECRGIIIPGGDKIAKIDLKIAKYLYDENIPTLGICQGMQVMALANNGIINKKALNNHYSNLNNHHQIIINKNSLLYEILNKNKIWVNSRHFDEIISTKLNISAVADLDHVIETIEDKKKKFYLGVQWHPESLNNKESKLLFNYFVKICAS